MASEAETPEISSLFERLLRHRDMSLFLPFILGFTGNISTTESNPEHTDQETSTNSSERIILINPLTQGMVVIEGTSSLDSLMRNLASKDGQPPASKASVEAMRSFKIGDSEDEKEGEVGECVVCLEEYEVGEMGKEMPCKHRFHAKCIEKWLGIHGSCPVCRYKMPVDEDEIGFKRDEQRREVWVSFSFNSGRRSGNSDPESNQTSPAADSESADVSSSPSSMPDQGSEN
ncbi:E3 ubiquitin-protein ligase MPSR1-like [Pistacia vera]|uniref:E3 ubiquitin-protein ligase MPSR1-like n=1 Tax=Pistacia vera TaxID=55513 RepID=UPI001263B21A|nr:E3 ubiquitin-protein ligase MPSR1-like [Pistacia vera]